MKKKNNSIWDTRFTSNGIASDEWITMKGAHVLLGDDGTVQAGAGGKFTGKKLSESLKYVWSKKGESEADLRAARMNNDWSIDPPASVDSWFLYENKGRDLSSEQVYTIGNADSATIEKESAKALQITFRNNERGTTCKTWVPKTTVIRQSEEQGGM